MKYRLFRLAAGALRLLARPLLWIGTLAAPVLALARWFEVRSIAPPACSDRPREWLPRLWQRGHSPDQTEPPR